MGKSGTWKELLERALHSPYLLLLFVASVLLSIASFYTTLVGLRPFVDHWIFATFITLAIQSLLFVVSWRLGFMFADKESIAMVDVAVFLVCFSLSVFFSFNSLFNVVFGEQRQQEASLGRLHDGATEVVDQVEVALRERTRQRAEETFTNPAYTHWRVDVLAIADLALAAAPDLRTKLDEQRREQSAKYEALNEAALALANDKGGFDDRIADLEQRLTVLDAERPGLLEGVPVLRGEVDGLELDIANKKSEMEAEEGGIGDTGKSGRGPVWSGLDREYRTLQALIGRKKEQLTIKETRIEAHDALRSELGKELRDLKLRFENIDTEIGDARARAQGARERLDAFGAGGGSVEQTVQALRTYPSSFEETSDVSYLEKAETLCTELSDYIKELDEPPPRLLTLSCDRGPIMSLIAPLVDALQARTNLERQCTGADAPSIHGMPFDDALAAARNCLDLSQLPYRRIRNEHETLDRLQREEGPNASEFTKTTNALLAAEKDGMLAFLIAVAMDLLVLFTGLIGAKSATTSISIRVYNVSRSDDPDVVAIKTLLGNVVPFDDKIGGVRYEGKVDVAAVSGDRQRELLTQLLVRNTAKGMVLASPDSEGLFYLRYGALDQFEEQLDRRGPRAHQPRGGASPSAVTPGTPDSSNTPVGGTKGTVRLFGRGERKAYPRTGRQVERAQGASAGAQAGTLGATSAPEHRDASRGYGAEPRTQETRSAGPSSSSRESVHQGGAGGIEAPDTPNLPGFDDASLGRPAPAGKGVAPAPVSAHVQDDDREEDPSLYYQFMDDIESDKSEP